MSESTKSYADFWFDPLCPWAWMTSRWIGEVQQVRDIGVRWHVMSLAVLNEDKDNPGHTAENFDREMGPVRVITAARELHGDDHVKVLYDAMGTRIHLRRQDDLDVVIAESLDQAGLPADLARYAHRDDYDGEVRASHKEGVSRVGEDVGTPIVAFNGTAFFGPVVTPAPKGEEAGRLWDGVVTVAAYPGFYELKRTRDQGPIFD